MKYCFILSALFALTLGGIWFSEYSRGSDTGTCTRGTAICDANCECGDDCSCCASCVCKHKR